MYEAFFQFAHRPFAAVPQVETYFPASSIETAREALTRCIGRGEGAGLLIGPAGSGKSLVCQLLARAFCDTLEVAYLSGAHLATRRALLQAILFELKQPYRGLDEGELRLALIDHVSKPAEGRHGLLLLVDEAQTLPVRLLEELRLITNLVRQGEPRVRLVLAGGHELEERFASPQLEAFSQRIAARCYLESFTRPETRAYVESQITVCGGQADEVFTEDAYESIHRATDGLPRLINQLCDHALILAYAGDRARLDTAGIEEAWADLQQLPAPWTEETGPRQFGIVSDSPGVVEFGGLDDEPGEPLTGEADDAVRVPLPLARGPAHDFDAEQHLDALGEHVDELEEEFHPAGTIRPEVEFVLPELTRTSASTFDEEEVVIDRYAEIEAAGHLRRPQVVSREGSELALLLKRFLETRSADVLRVSEELPRKTQSTATAAPGAPTTAATTVAAEAPNRTEPAAAERVAEDELDLIVVEDEPEETRSVTVPSRPLVRRQEYRQLFAKLRSG